jgi:hypothetical protein
MSKPQSRLLRNLLTVGTSSRSSKYVRSGCMARTTGLAVSDDNYPLA